MNGILENLRKELLKEFPPHHYAHLQIMMTFWGFYELVQQEK